MAVLAAFGLVLAACGNDDDSADASADTPAASEGDASDDQSDESETGASETEDEPSEGDAAEADESEVGASGAEPPDPDDVENLANLRAASGDAPAATTSGLTERPGDPERVPLEGFGETALAIRDAEGEVSGHCVLVAASADQRQRGLMEVEDLGGYSGMLFVFHEDTNSGFFMLNTPMPLSIGWFDADGVFVSSDDMEALDADTIHEPRASYRFALEVPQGELPPLDESSRLAAGGPCVERS